MKKLFVKKSIDIHAPVSKVWAVLTDPQYTSKWAHKFMNGAEFHIDSDWKLGSDVFWTVQGGAVMVTGKVTAVEPNKLLRFTVYDVRGKKPNFSEEDGITYTLTSENDVTRLSVLQGDFSIIPNGEKYCNVSSMIWDSVLAIVKRISET